MNNLLDFSMYLNDLNRQGKHENVLISFNDNAHNFNQEEISGNAYLVYNLLNSFRKTHQIEEGFNFIEKYDISPIGQQKIVLNIYGWFLYDNLKKEADTQNNAPSSTKIDSCIIKAKALIPILDISNSHDINLLKLLISVLLRIEKRKDLPDHNTIFDIFKLIKLKNNVEMQKIIASDEYIISFAIDILKKSEQYRYAVPLLGLLNIDLQIANEKILNSFGWLLFSKLKAEFNNKDEIPEGETHDDMNSYLLEMDEDLNDAKASGGNETIQKIIKIISLFDIKSKYSPFSKLFQLVIKFEKSRPNPNWEFVLDFISLFSVNSLNDECEQFTFEKNGKLKNIELASDQEIWHSSKIAALFKLNKYQECLNAIENAKLNIKKLHYSNDTWFLWKVGLCKHHLNKIHEAIIDIEKVLLNKPEWFVQKELAELYFAAGKTDDALNLAIDAALNYGDKEKKDSLFYNLGQIFQKNNENEMAYQHYTLAKLIRENQQWKIPQKYLSALSNPLFISFTQATFSLHELYKKLLNYWKTLKSKKLPLSNHDIVRPISKNDKLLGKIKMINYEKGFGFIMDSTGNEHYFKTKNITASRGTNLSVNNNVSFEYLPPNGSRKGEAVKVALCQI